MKFFLFLVLALSCATLSAQKTSRFINHTNKTGTKTNYGQTVAVNVYTYLKDSLVHSTARDMGGVQMLTLPDSTQKDGYPEVLTALLKMTESDSASIFLPLDSSAIANIKMQFPEMADIKEVHYVIVLVDQLSPEELAAKMAALEQEEAARLQMADSTRARVGAISDLVATAIADYKAGKLADRLKKSPSGLEYYVVKAGSGPNFKEGATVNTHYYGVLLSNGTMFDNSFETGTDYPFVVGQMIPGFNEGMTLLNDGSAAVLFIPAALAYGEQGAGGQIPPNADLVFYLELKK